MNKGTVELGKSAALAIERLDVAYGDTPVLRDVSLDVASGEFVALLGSSGCGKTTLLRTIAGFSLPKSGRILVDGTDVAQLPPEKRDMALVFQSYALWPHMTAGQNIAYGLKLRGWSKRDRQARVEEMLSLLGLAGLADRPVTRLSGGQRQRVALGRALAVNPRILLLDEPLSNLDARIRQVVRHEIKALQSRLAITTIHVTHDREEAMVMADRIAILDAGRVAQYGTPQDVFNRPASPFVATFMGADNVLAVTVAVTEGQVHCQAAATRGQTSLPIARGDHDADGLYLPVPFAGAANLHFRSEQAGLQDVGEAPRASALHLAGHITQATYPGGRHRYAVDVDGAHFLVDDARRFAVGAAVTVAIPADALHLFPA